MHIAMIVAVTTNGVIGRDNQLPWRLPNDLKYFKKTTMGKPVIMGRKTFESIGKPLPGRCNIVVTTDRQYAAAGCKIAHSVDEALAVARGVAEADGVDELMVIGGEGLYRAAFAQATRLYLTEVHTELEGDAFFPDYDVTQWQERSRERYPAEGDNPYAYSFTLLERIGKCDVDSNKV